MKGLNFISSICVGLSFVVDKINWDVMEIVNFFCIGDGSHRFS